MQNVEQMVGKDEDAASLKEAVKAELPVSANIKPFDELPHIVSTRVCGKPETTPSRPTSGRRRSAPR